MSQQSYIKASNSGAEDRFGWSVGMSPKGIIVGAFNEESNGTGIDPEGNDDSMSGAGAAYLFSFDNDARSWTQLNYIKPSAIDENDNFGSQVCLSNTTIAISAPYEDSNATGINGDANDNSVSGTGAVFIFQ